MNPNINPTPPAPATPPVAPEGTPIPEPTPTPNPSQTMADGGKINLPNDFTIVNYGLGILIFVGMIYNIRTNRALLNALYK